MHVELRLLVLWLGLVTVGTLAVAQPAARQDEADQQWQEKYRSEAAGNEFSLRTEQGDKLQMHPTAVMRWVSLNDYNGSVSSLRHAQQSVRKVKNSAARGTRKIRN